jgi:hypothetical protein
LICFVGSFSVITRSVVNASFTEGIEQAKNAISSPRKMLVCWLSVDILATNFNATGKSTLFSA